MQLVQLPDGHLLEAAAAASWERMSRARGAAMDIPLPLGAYRTYAQQAELRAAYEAGTGAYALPPGTSVHEVGRAADYGTSRSWLAMHGADHGWYRTNPDEDWHYEYDPARDHYVGELPPTFDQEDDEMFTIQRGTVNGTVALIGSGGYVILGKHSQATWRRILTLRAGGVDQPPIVVSTGDFDTALSCLAQWTADQP